MITVGLTGGIGAGKSLVASIFEELGYKVFHSDKVAKELMHSDPDVKKAIIALLGDSAYRNGTLDRAYVARRIFDDKDLREKVNQIVHPATRSAFNKFIDQSDGANSIVFNEAAILFETGAYKNFDKVILVSAPEDLRIDRVIKRDGSSKDEIQKRISSQWDDRKKSELADFVIVNDEKQPLLKQIEEVLSELR